MVIIIEEFLYILESNAFETLFTEFQITNQAGDATVFDGNCDVFEQIFALVDVCGDGIIQQHFSQFITYTATVFNESSVALTFESRSVFQEYELTLL